jgi:pimeloyl-ACP methyl ester carboxylesterase
MNGPDMPTLTRREIGRNVLMLGASVLGLQSKAGLAAPQGAAPVVHARPETKRPDTSQPVEAAKDWLMLPATPSLPSPKRSEVVTVNGTPVFFAQFGDGPAVLFLHGGLGNSNYWGHQVHALAEKFTVTVMDTRGHGRSPVTSGKFGFNVFADDAAALLAVLGIASAAIVGWSDGAITGLQLAMTRPDLVTRLFAFGANSSVGGLRPGGARTPVFASYAARCAREYKQLSPHPERWSELVSGLGVMWRSQPNFTKPQLAVIKPPTVVSDGEYDEIIKHEHTEQIARQIPNARLVIQPSVSHFAMLQNPDQFNQELAKFLTADH